jgi:hypothetical protein
LTLIGSEVIAVVIAAGRAFGAWNADWSGILAAAVAAGAARLGLEQYGELFSAYSVAANELAMAADRLESGTDAQWGGHRRRRRGGHQPRTHFVAGLPFRPNGLKRRGSAVAGMTALTGVARLWRWRRATRR